MKYSKFIFASLIITIMIILPISCSKKSPYKKVAVKAFIYRNNLTKKTSLAVEEHGKWSLYLGKTPDNIDFSKPILEGDGNGIFDVPISTSARAYFCIETRKGRILLAEKLLPMEGGYNFRDLGGITTMDNKHVKWGKFIRADELGNLTNSDLDYLSSIPIVTIVDFRSKEEINNAPDKMPASVKNMYPLSIAPGNMSFSSVSNILMSDSATNDIEKMMINMNYLFVHDSNCINVYKEFFAILQKETNTPVLFHCTAGKDRTGFAAAMLLYALGVDEQTIMNNYLESNAYLSEKYKNISEKYPKLKPAFSVKKDYLQKAIDEIKGTHGSVENYLKTVLNVDIEKMRKLYLD